MNTPRSLPALIVACLLTVSISATGGILSATFVGGSDSDAPNDMAIADDGTVYVAGYTTSIDFPTSPGAFDESSNSDEDTFVCALSPGLDELLAATLIGGSNNEYLRSLAFDNAGNLILGGATDSTNFPVTAGAFDTSHNGGFDSYITRMPPTLDSLMFSTYLGGTETDYLSEIACGPSVGIVAIGYTQSGDFPVTTGAYDTSHNGSYDVFLTRLSPFNGYPLASTFLGTLGLEQGRGVLVEESGTLIALVDQRLIFEPLEGNEFEGESMQPDSTAHSFETRVADYDFIVYRMPKDLSAVLSTYRIQGLDDDRAWDFCLVGSGDLGILGRTRSEDFPVTADAWDTSINGSDGNFVMRMSASDGSILASTFLGYEASTAFFNQIAALPDGSLVVGGYIDSGSAFFGRDGLLMTMSPNLESLVHAQAFGGGDDDELVAMELDSLGNAVVAGWTEAGDFPVTPGAFDTSYNGIIGDRSRDVFVARVSLDESHPFFTDLEIFPSPITLPGGAYIRGYLSNIAFVKRHFDMTVSAVLPNGAVVENLRTAHRVVGIGDTYKFEWFQNFPVIDLLNGTTIFKLHAVDVSPPPFNQPPYPPSGKTDTSEWPLEIIVP